MGEGGARVSSASGGSCEGDGDVAAPDAAPTAAGSVDLAQKKKKKGNNSKDDESDEEEIDIDVLCGSGIAARD